MTNSFVSPVVRILKTRVTFQNGRTLTLPSGSPYADDLLFAKRAHRPALVKADGQVITFGGPAWISGVNRTQRVKQGLLVFLRGRSSALLLQSRHHNFNQLSELFTSAVLARRVLAVAQAPATKIITDAIPSRTEAFSGERIENLRQPPRLDLKPTTLARVKTAIKSFKRAECFPTRKGLPAGSLCVPFNFPDDGCNARAAFMCDALKKRGIASGKVFCFAGSRALLTAKTGNAPCGRVSWIFHVATVVRIGDVEFVVDPALSKVHVTIEDWKKLMSGGSGARVVVTSADVFGLDQPEERPTWAVHYDTRGARAAAELANARQSLSVSAKFFGAPPYKKPVTACV